MLISIILTILLFGVIFKLTGLVIKLVGKVFGAVLGIIGYSILGFVSIGVLGLALAAFPVILTAGAATILLLTI